MNKSTLKTLEIIELLSEVKDGMTTSEIASQLKIPVTTTHDIIKALKEEEYIQYKSETLKKFELNPIKFLGISSKVLGKIDSDQIVRDEIRKLSLYFNETVFYAKGIANEVVYFAKMESSKSVRTTAVLGTKNPMYCTGLGKAILSTYSDEEIEKYVLFTKLDKKTDFTLTNPEELFNDIKKTQELGYSIDKREGENHLLCVASPIRNNKRVLGAISITGLYQDLTDEDVKVRGEKVKEVALNISKKLGYQNN